MICEIICIYFFILCMSHLDIVHILSAYVHFIHILSEHMHIMCTLSEVVLDIFLPNRQYQCYPYIISSTLYIFYHVQLSFHTLSTQMHIVHVIYMLSAYVHIICLSSLTFLVYPIIHNLVSANCLHICTLSMSSAYCLQMHILCTSHFYCCYLHMYISSAYYLSICVICAHYVQWSLICSYPTDNAYVIHTSTLVLFIYPIIYNLVSAHCHCQCHLDVVHTCRHHLLVIPNTPRIPYYPQLSFHTLSPHTSIVYVISILSTDAYVMYISFILLLFAYVHVIHII